MTELAKKQVCVLIRSGLELWIDAEREEELEKVLADSTKRFIRINGQLVNPFEVLGVFTPDAMEDRQRRKNGQWKCLKGNWHDKTHMCECKGTTQVVTAYVEGVGEVTYQK